MASRFVSISLTERWDECALVTRGSSLKRGSQEREGRISGSCP